MTMAFSIEWLERKTTSTGKEKYNATLKNVDSQETVENVTIWSDYPNFQNLAAGATVYGTLVPSKDPKYGPTLYAPRPEVASTARATRSGGITKAMETKAENIKEAQENRENGVKLASTYRMAVDVVTARGVQGYTQEDIQSEINFWRKWFWEKWDEPKDRQWPTV